MKTVEIEIPGVMQIDHLIAKKGLDIKIATDLKKPSFANAVINRSADFWLLGGASILFWFILLFADKFKENISVGHHLANLPLIFLTLSLICNYPHFIISYKFAYGRGPRFVAQHWFSLVAVPVLLITLFTFAYFGFTHPTYDSPWAWEFNDRLSSLGINFKIGSLSNWGVELVGYSVWIMFLTVGWHYGKQIYGCLMAYSRFDNYPLNDTQKMIIRLNLLSIAWLGFFYSSRGVNTMNPFVSSELIQINFPPILITVVNLTTLALSLATLVFVVGQKYYLEKKLPSVNFLVPWVAFHIWWIPLFQGSDFFLLSIPFFHCLQYLPFAYRLDSKNSKGLPVTGWRKSYFFNAAVIVAVGFLAFEFIPNILDTRMSTPETMRVWFFTGATLVFLNVHHFFMDSVSWRFKDAGVREKIFN